MRNSKRRPASGEQNPMGPERRKPYPTPPMKMTPLLSDFKAACEAAGTTPFRTPAGNMSEEYTNPDGMTLAACQYCGFCEKFGCEWGAKSSPIVTTIPVAKQQDSFELRTNANVLEIMKEDGK